MGTYKLRVKAHFDAAHRFIGYDGACANIHGHRWVVEVVYLFNSVGSDGMCADFKGLKAELEAILPDHKYLNDILDINSTAENIAKWIYSQIQRPVESVTVWETPECGVTCAED